MAKNEKKSLGTEEQLRKLKKRFRAAVAALALFAAMTGFFIYLNYDYLAFKFFMAYNYIYTDALDKLFARELKRDVKGKYFSYFDDAVISVFTKSIRDINLDRYTYLYTPENYKKYLREEKEEAAKSEIKVLDDKTVYLRLTNFSKYTASFVKENLKLLGKYPCIIIDLRDNCGGDIDAMAEISDCFLPKESIIAVDKMRLFSRTYKAKKDRILAFERIFILQNKNTASSSENMIAALKDNLSNVTLIGEKTFGKGIGQYTLPLKRGFAVKATVLLWYTAKGVNIQGNGIEPDIRYTGDDVLEFALGRLADLL